MAGAGADCGWPFGHPVRVQRGASQHAAVILDAAQHPRDAARCRAQWNKARARGLLSATAHV